MNFFSFSTNLSESSGEESHEKGAWRQSGSDQLGDPAESRLVFKQKKKGGVSISLYCSQTDSYVASQTEVSEADIWNHDEASVCF